MLADRLGGGAEGRGSMLRLWLWRPALLILIKMVFEDGACTQAPENDAQVSIIY